MAAASLSASSLNASFSSSVTRSVQLLGSALGLALALDCSRRGGRTAGAWPVVPASGALCHLPPA
eukprot:15444045-Alexandrium_andersonii.AAC.1